MVICVCSAITESTLRNLIKCNKIRSVRDFHKLNVCCNCAKCYKEINDIIKEEHESNIHQISGIR
jgi:bacterioferritin-associated ferredoxin